MAEHSRFPDLSSLNLPVAKRLLAQRDIGYLGFRVKNMHVVLKQAPVEKASVFRIGTPETVKQNSAKTTAQEKSKGGRVFVRAPATGFVEWRSDQEPRLGDALSQGDVLGTVRSGERQVELRAEVSGTVRLIRNTGEPGLIQYGDWLLVIEQN